MYGEVVSLDVMMNEIPFRARVAVARALLESGPETGSGLSAQQRAYVEETVEFLRAVEDGFRGDAGRE